MLQYRQTARRCSSATSLDPYDFTGHDDLRVEIGLHRPLAGSYEHRRHASWQQQREEVAAVLFDTGSSRGQLLRFLTCGRDAKVWRGRDDPARCRISCSKCRNRWCLPCQRDKGWRIAQSLLERMKLRATRFITLTLAVSKQPLRLQLDRLLKCFKHLRRTTLWTESQRGGIAFVEATFNAATGYWHPHLHVISEGKWIGQGFLSQAWHQVTGDSFITHVAFIKQRREVTSYVTKYLCSGFAADVLDRPVQLREAVASMHGFHTVIRYGSWAKSPTKWRPDPEAWVLVGRWEDLQREFTGDPACPSCLRRRWIAAAYDQ